MWKSYHAREQPENILCKQRKHRGRANQNEQIINKSWYNFSDGKMGKYLLKTQQNVVKMQHISKDFICLFQAQKDQLLQNKSCVLLIPSICFPSL